MIVSLPSRNQLLTWVSQLTNTNIERLQDLSDGLAFCQIFDKMYPRIINMTKLKKEPKVPLEKEKNFRLLLNAVNQLGLCVAINIIDLSHGKVTSILQLLQWFYKQYKNPIGRQLPGYQSAQKLPEPRMIKTYVGNLIDRQKSHQKDVKPRQSDISSSRRSLDSKIMIKNVFGSENSQSVRSKSVFHSEKRKTNEKKQKSSKSKTIVLLDEQKFQQRCSEKKESMKKQLSEKVQKSSLKSSESISQKKPQKEERKVLQVLNKALTAQKPKLQNTLIRITQAALDGNPELEGKIRQIIESESKKQQAPSNLLVSPDHQVRNILNSYRNSSQICECDTLERTPLENFDSKQIVYPDLTEKPKILLTKIFNSVAFLPQQVTNKNSVQKDKKETVKRSTTKGSKQSLNKSLLSQSSKFSKKSSKKQKIQILPQKQKEAQENQNQPQNQNQVQSQIEPSKCFSFDPHRKLENQNNPQTYLTEKKAENSKKTKFGQNHRQAQSQNLSTILAQNSNDVWKKDQNFEPKKTNKP